MPFTNGDATEPSRVDRGELGLPSKLLNNPAEQQLSAHKACWVQPEDPKNKEFEEFKRVKQRYLAKDKQGQLVFLADSAFTIQMTQSKFPTIKLHFTSEFE